MVAEKRILVNNVDVLKPVSEGGWEKEHAMYISMYSHKNRTVESLQHCFMALHWVKCPSGDPGMAVEVRDAKMTWLHLREKSKCATGSSDKEMDKEASDDEEVEGSQELLGGEAKAQTMPFLMTAKKAIELDNESGSGSNTDLSAFEKSFKRAKNVSALPKKKSSSFSVSSLVNTVERKK
eukprot:3633572-Ditylum_brightwellii.AAC.1